MNFYGATVLIGGGTGALDKIDGADLLDGDGALVITATGIHFYILDADLAGAESSPDIIAPDTNAGDKRWKRVDLNYFGEGVSVGIPGADGVHLRVYKTGGDVTIRVESATDNANMDISAANDEWAKLRFLGTSGTIIWGLCRVGGTLDLIFFDYVGGAGEVMRLQYNTGFVGINCTDPKSFLHVCDLPVYANNAAAIVGGLTAGAFYRTGADPDPVCVVH